MSVEDWENRMLSLPEASAISGEHDEHQPGVAEFVPHRDPMSDKCSCARCKIIRIKRRRAFRFPRRKCPNCGELFFSLFDLCANCRGEEGTAND